MKHILLPTDFSDNSWNAIFFALKLFQGVPSHFSVLNTYDPDPKNIIGARTYVRTGMIIDALETASKEGLQKIEDYLKKNHTTKEHSFDFLSVKGELVPAVREIQKEKDVDYIIMGTLGATGAKTVFMGTNSVRVVKSIRNCPIILVPSGYNLQKLQRIVFPTDFSKHYNRYELMPLTELSTMTNAQCHIFWLTQEHQMTEEQENHKKVMEKRLAEVDVSFHEAEFSRKLAQGIHDFAKEQQADMIALVHHTHTFMEKLTREPVVKKVAFQSPIPILVVPKTD